jgi:[acyl-carrier-protein] S-malonyltransferase
MASIFIFPGQGSQAVGMGKDLYDNNADARAIFEEVDSALNQKLSSLIFNGPIEELTMTANVQPAIFAVSMAMLRAFGGITSDVKYVAGHSLGEYTALCAVGAISVSDAAKLLRLRGESMQRAVPAGKGAMAVIMGLEIDKIKEICENAEKSMPADHFNVADVANDNSPGQVVISGGEQTILRAMEMAKEIGAKRAMLLPLSVPPHSRLMAPVAIEMQEALDKVEMKNPSLPLISNKTTTPITDVNEIKEALIYQITHGVRWRETILGLPALGITETVEVGPGAILTGMTPRIVPELSARKLEI